MARKIASAPPLHPKLAESPREGVCVISRRCALRRAWVRDRGGPRGREAGAPTQGLSLPPSASQAEFTKRRHSLRVARSGPPPGPAHFSASPPDSRKVSPTGREKPTNSRPPPPPVTVLAGGSCSSTIMINVGDASFKRHGEVSTVPRSDPLHAHSVRCLAHACWPSESAVEPVGGAARRHSSTRAHPLCTPDAAILPIQSPSQRVHIICALAYRLTLEMDRQSTKCAQVLESKAREGCCR